MECVEWLSVSFVATSIPEDYTPTSLPFAAHPQTFISSFQSFLEVQRTECHTLSSGPTAESRQLHSWVIAQSLIVSSLSRSCVFLFSQCFICIFTVWRITLQSFSQNYFNSEIKRFSSYFNSWQFHIWWELLMLRFKHFGHFYFVVAVYLRQIKYLIIQN